MTRTFVMGDPQAPADKLMAVLDRHAALRGDRLADDVVLISIGDHFDYDHADPITAGENGLTFLRWLASHDPAQVVLLLGNHDVSRVMELAGVSDARFAQARAFARQLDGDVARDARFVAAFPELATAGLADRDYASFSVAQRALVRELLLAGRFQLARTGALADGRPVLLSHAGVTRRELAMLGVADDAAAIAAGLAERLASAIAAVRDDWTRGGLTPLSLAPLHVAGASGEEGGGLLYHRPTNPDRPGADRRWALAVARPRRFDPRTLPLGITQVVGHSGHAKCVSELGAWVTPAARARAHGGIRTLRFDGETVRYDLGVAPPAAGVADLILVDGEARRVPADDIDLLPLARLD